MYNLVIIYVDPSVEIMYKFSVNDVVNKINKSNDSSSWTPKCLNAAGKIEARRVVIVILDKLFDIRDGLLKFGLILLPL